MAKKIKQLWLRKSMLAFPRASQLPQRDEEEREPFESFAALLEV
jgi:hypothetical protein